MILFKYLKDDIELVYINSYKRSYYPILADFIINYNEQVIIIDIKANMKYLICYILSKERKLITEL